MKPKHTMVFLSKVFPYFDMNFYISGTKLVILCLISSIGLFSVVLSVEQGGPNL